MSIWCPEIPRPGNYPVIECAMKGFCERFRDMPIMALPNICARLPTISKWTSSISDVFSGWQLCGVFSWFCVLFICDLVLTCKKKEKRVKIENCSYQSFLSTDSSLNRRRRNVPFRVKMAVGN